MKTSSFLIKEKDDRIYATIFFLNQTFFISKSPILLVIPGMTSQESFLPVFLAMPLACKRGQ